MIQHVWLEGKDVYFQNLTDKCQELPGELATVLSQEVVDALRKHVFEGIMGWRHGLDFQVAALQATNASSLDGHTLHAAFGMTPFGCGSEGGKKRAAEGAKNVAAPLSPPAPIPPPPTLDCSNTSMPPAPSRTECPV